MFLLRTLNFRGATTVNDLINARGVYYILGVLGGAFNRYEAFIREGRLFQFN